MAVAIAVLAVVIALLVGCIAGALFAFTALRRLSPEREGELVAELAAIRAAGRLGLRHRQAREQMIRAALDEPA